MPWAIVFASVFTKFKSLVCPPFNLRHPPGFFKRTTSRRGGSLYILYTGWFTLITPNVFPGEYVHAVFSIQTVNLCTHLLCALSAKISHPGCLFLVLFDFSIFRKMWTRCVSPFFFRRKRIEPPPAGQASEWACRNTRAKFQGLSLYKRRGHLDCCA